MTRVPTELQYRLLRNLASGAAGLGWKKKATDPLLRRRWVTAELKDTTYFWVRITPTGLRALADAADKYGLSELPANPKREVPVCAKCGSTRIRIEHRDVEVPA